MRGVGGADISTEIGKAQFAKEQIVPSNEKIIRRL
jgi:hypothetical protein